MFGWKILLIKPQKKVNEKIYQSQVLSGLTTENTKLNNFNSHFGTRQLYFKHGHHHQKSELYWETVLKKFRGGDIKMY